MDLKSNFSERENKKKLESYFDNEIKRFSNLFMRVGEGFVNDARSLNTYRDRTGNLRSSIGYAIGIDGKIEKQNTKQIKQGSKGVKKGEQLAQDSIDDNGLVLVGYAGMEYARHVEEEDLMLLQGLQNLQ